MLPVSLLSQHDLSSVNVCPLWLSTAPGALHPWSNCTRGTSGMTLGNPLLTRAILHSAYSMQTTELFSLKVVLLPFWT